MKVMMVMGLVGWFSRQGIEDLTGRLFSEEDLHTILKNRKRENDPEGSDRFKVLDLSEFSDICNNEEFKPDRWWIAPVCLTEGDEKTWVEIRSKVHDISGIEDPSRYTFTERHGIWYPDKSSKGLV